MELLSIQFFVKCSTSLVDNLCFVSLAFISHFPFFMINVCFICIGCNTFECHTVHLRLCQDPQVVSCVNYMYCMSDIADCDLSYLTSTP